MPVKMNDSAIRNPQSELPEGWRWARLGDVCEKPTYGYTASAEAKPAGPKLLRITDIQGGKVNWDSVPHCKCNDNEIDKYLLKSGDILFARTGGSTGKTYLIGEVPPKTIFASYLIRVRTSRVLMPEFLYLFLQSDMYWREVESNKRGGAQPNMNATLLANIVLPLPPIPEQKHLTEKIQKLMQEVERARTACEKQLEAAKALPTAYLRQVFESEEARKWERERLGEVCVSTKNRDPSTTPDSPFRYVDISSVDNSSKRIIEARTILGKDAPSRARQVIKGNDVLVATTRPNLNAVALVPEELNDEICSTGFCVLRPTEAISPLFLFFFVQTRYFIDTISGQVRGMLYPAVTDSHVRNAYIPLPPRPEQERIAVELKEKMARVEKLRTAIEKQLEGINALPQAILRKAFRGEL